MECEGTPIYSAHAEKGVIGCMLHGDRDWETIPALIRAWSIDTAVSIHSLHIFPPTLESLATTFVLFPQYQHLPCFGSIQEIADLGLIYILYLYHCFFFRFAVRFFLLAADGDVLGSVVIKEASVSQPVEQIFWSKVVGVDEPTAAADKPHSNSV